MSRAGVLSAAAVIAIAGLCGADELITNGDFEAGYAVMPPSGLLDGLTDIVPLGWTRYETFNGGIVEYSRVGVATDNGPSAVGIRAAYFQRLTPVNTSGDWTAITQPLSVGVASYSLLTLSMDVKVLSHTLEAGGTATPAFEWPVMVQLDYLDAADTPQVWRHGWYLADPGDGARIDDPGSGLIPIYQDTQVAADTWVSNSFDLLAELPQAKTITGIRLAGTGWNFEGRVDNVSLLGAAGVLPMAIDIRPGDPENAINLSSQGVVQVALLGSEGFDVTAVDELSLRLAGAAPQMKGNSGKIGLLQYVNDDAFMDLQVQFPMAELTELDPAAVEAVLTGLLSNGTAFAGQDAVRIVGPTGGTSGAEAVPVPEPATLGLLALGGLALIRPRR